MTSTNRFANRLLLFVVGLVLFLAGLAAIALMSAPTLTDAWNRMAPDAVTAIESFVRAAAVSGSDTNWAIDGAVAVLAILIVLLLVFIFLQGRGHTRRLIVRQSGEHGTTIIESVVAVDALHDALIAQPDLLGEHVAAYRVHGATALKVAVTARRGASPRAIGDRIDELVAGLDRLLGFDVPVFVQISGGFRARSAPSARLEHETAIPRTSPVAPNLSATVEE